jgi:predicted dehydrogenase/threonine dehydrogenase-like Zn-dependent dehydrogenase
MRQLLQHLKSGELTIEDVASPKVRPCQLLIRTSHSLISVGTERMLHNFANSGYIQKAKQQPDKVKQVLDKVKTDGLIATYEAVKDKLEQPLPMGYCNVGTVIATGAGVKDYAVGDRVASNGKHAEVVSVPVNLCAKVPDAVSSENATFTVIASIALQGVRLVAPMLGETVVVSGLGLIGLLSVQLLQASGARVIGFDYNPDRVARAQQFGSEAHDLSTGVDPVAVALASSGGAGVDAVMITAATQSHDLISQSAKMSRKRGRIVLTGVVGLNIRRDDFYEKELTFQVSCSYGPGRYDTTYEEGGIDYPLPFVRWTEQRNFGAILELMAADGLEVGSLITRRFNFDEAVFAYETLNDSSSIGVVLDYGAESADNIENTKILDAKIIHAEPRAATTPGIGVIGAGPFTQAKLLPGLKKAGARLAMIASSQGVSGSIAARRFGIEASTSDAGELLAAKEVGTVLISTPHHTHARFVMDAVKAGKHVFVEKPLCLNREELGEIIDLRAEELEVNGQAPAVIVGFNRRFAPLAVKMKTLLDTRSGPAFLNFFCNAGALPADSPHHDPAVGGGRIIGEACHFIDFLAFLTGELITNVRATKMGVRQGGADFEDTASITLEFADGSLGQVNYVSIGHKTYPKEHCTATWDGKTLELNNFLRLKGYGVRNNKRSFRQDKGHDAEMKALVRFATGKDDLPISFEETVNAMSATFAAVISMRNGGEGVAV